VQCSTVSGTDVVNMKLCTNCTV